MTAAQITSILGVNNIGTVNFIHIPTIIYIAFKKDKNVLRSDIADIRFRFNMVQELMEVVYCRPYSKQGTLPPHPHYDILDYQGVSTVFEYLTDENNQLLVDYYDFDSITTIGLV